ncbi:hypothetical protein MNBD_GAMMA10-766 [hydrothermal vent metagenome]|uniref:Uncharacterized protein n=1 Tax=hydrothermal vent metagenome TaxID=652676 RepID=A0A3B0XXE9_9ZZZZ
MNNVRNIKRYVEYIEYMKIHPVHIVDNDVFLEPQKETINIEITNTRKQLKLNDKSIKKNSNRKFLYAIG